MNKKLILMMRVSAMLNIHGRTLSRSLRTSAKRTRKSMRDRIIKIFSDIYDEGFHIDNPKSLKTRHVKSLVKSWERRNLCPSTISAYMSAVRRVCEWINKKGMVGDTKLFVSNPDEFFVACAAREDKSWQAKGIDVLAVIRAVSKKNILFGLVLALQHAFGLRASEAMMLMPAINDKGCYLDIYQGAKGGRARVIPIECEDQRLLLEEVKKHTCSKNGNLIPASAKKDNWSRNFYRTCNQFGISQKEGVVPHGLRHGYLQNVYEVIAGALSPVRRGPNDIEPDKLLDKLAKKEVSERASHSRPQVTSYYIGSTDSRVQKKPKDGGDKPDEGNEPGLE